MDQDPPATPTTLSAQDVELQTECDSRLFDLSAIQNIVTLWKQSDADPPQIGHNSYHYLQDWLKAVGELEPIPMEVLQTMAEVKRILAESTVVAEDDDEEDFALAEEIIESVDYLHAKVDGIQDTLKRAVQSLLAIQEGQTPPEIKAHDLISYKDALQLEAARIAIRSGTIFVCCSMTFVGGLIIGALCFDGCHRTVKVQIGFDQTTETVTRE